VSFAAPYALTSKKPPSWTRLSPEAKPARPDLGYQKFKAQAYRVAAAAGQTVGAIEDHIGQRVAFGRIVRHGSDVEMKRQTVLECGDEVVLTGPASTLIKAGTSIGPEIEDAEVLRQVLGDALGVLVTNNELHGRTLSEIADRVGDAARGVCALAGAMTVDAAVTGSCERADSQTPVLGGAVPYAVGSVLLTILVPVIVTLTYAG
jgi:uncharacterized transporter YbjL